MTALLPAQPAPPVDAPVRTVADNAACAWRNSSQGCLLELPGDFVADFRSDLDAAAITAMALTLPEAWAATGLGWTVRWVSEAEMGSPWGPRDGVADDWYWAAWDRAAEAIDAHALVAAVRLGDECATYRD